MPDLVLADGAVAANAAGDSSGAHDHARPACLPAAARRPRGARRSDVADLQLEGLQPGEDPAAETCDDVDS